MTKDQADIIEHAVNSALAAHRSAFEARVSGIEARAELFAAVLGLVSFVTDAPACRKRLGELEAATGKLERAQSKLDADARKHADAVAAFEAERATVGQLKVELKEANAKIAELGLQLGAKTSEEYLARHPLPQGRLVAVGGNSSMLQEIFDDPTAADPHYGSAA